MGKATAGMKQSTLEKIIKSCKEGLPLTVQGSHDTRPRATDHTPHYITPGQILSSYY